ncbi:16S rRNA (guanine(527)-N(7))-methyltransferase RsmG [Silvibacterium acidisoli]|uniref:16S rRNA (guanine(527)-N(7))-methyltransferase RsmG n=1 Tax=Acidobacteriaceae bacterium ZG23-2 TaxID=2883246 RepID=UPI00406C2BEC
MIAEALEKYGLKQLDPRMIEQLEAYLDLLIFWNSRQNLTAVRDRAGIIERHIVESIACAQQLTHVQTLLDFGSGAGFPGIPIAVARPEIEVTLAESQNKKATFLREAVRTLQLTATVHGGRVETLPESLTFDCVTMRAVDKTLEALPLAWGRVGRPGILAVFSTESSADRLRTALPDADWSDLKTPGQLPGGILLAGAK